MTWLTIQSTEQFYFPCMNKQYHLAAREIIKAYFSKIETLSNSEGQNWNKQKLLRLTFINVMTINLEWFMFRSYTCVLVWHKLLFYVALRYLLNCFAVAVHISAVQSSILSYPYYRHVAASHLFVIVECNMYKRVNRLNDWLSSYVYCVMNISNINLLNW